MPRFGITQNYLDFISKNTRAIIGHLYTFTSVSGTLDYFTDLDVDITYGGNLYKSSSLRIDGMRRKTSVGLEVDEQEVKIYALPAETLFGGTFLSGAESGTLDGCLIQRVRAVWQIHTGNLLVDVTTYAPLQVWTMFIGYASEIVKGGQTRIEMKVKSPLVKLEVNMPRNYYQPGCLWSLFDVGMPVGFSGCSLLQSNFAVSGTVAAGPTSLQIPVSGGISPAIGLDGIAQYAQGRIAFTSGANNGITALINTNDASILYLAYPLTTVPTAGDTFTYYPGCSKSYNTCQLKFANQGHFRGFDKVPPISVSI